MTAPPLGGGIVSIPFGIGMILFGNVPGGIFVIAWHLIVVTNADHSRRLRRVLRRSMRGLQTKVIVRASRYSAFDPDRWWTTRAGARTGIVEIEKLLLDVVRHPMS